MRAFFMRKKKPESCQIHPDLAASESEIISEYSLKGQGTPLNYLYKKKDIRHLQT
jgi:hypothetical protein